MTNLTFFAAIGILIFLIGLVIYWVSHPKKPQEPVILDSYPKRTDPPWYVPFLYFAALTPFLLVGAISWLAGTVPPIVGIVMGVVIFGLTCAANWYKPLRKKVDYWLTLQEDERLAAAWAEPTLYALNGTLVFVAGLLIILAMSFGTQTTSNSSEISSLKEYDARLAEICKDEKETPQRFAACTWTVLLNDEMTTGTLRMFAQQERYAIEAYSASSLSDEELLNELLESMEGMLGSDERYVSEIGIKTSALLTEFDRRNLTNSRVEEMRLQLLEKWGPCWGIPEGQCRE